MWLSVVVNDCYLLKFRFTYIRLSFTSRKIISLYLRKVHICVVKFHNDPEILCLLLSYTE